MATVDIAGFIAGLKEHAIEHGFHVHDERHYVETYTLRQNFEVDLHPESACGEPLDLHLSLDVDPRVLLRFEDSVLEMDEGTDPPDGEFGIPLFFTWGMPPLAEPPDLLVLATELAAVGGPDLPLEVSAIDSTAAVSEAPERRLSIVGTVEVSLTDIYQRRRALCDVLDRCHDVSEFLLSGTSLWMAE